ncbi:hypothetical protein FJY63_12420, partial [Candidatus Sumerlaeota bacterium]|nr:hypothetical protein [Candidatus Sumerlaeota bacterium]
MAELARGNLRTAAQAPALVFGVAAAAAAVGFAVATGPRPVHVIAATLIGIAALLKPAWGLVGYLVLAATLPSSEGVSDSEIACFGLLG